MSYSYEVVFGGNILSDSLKLLRSQKSNSPKCSIITFITFVIVTIHARAADHQLSQDAVPSAIYLFVVTYSHLSPTSLANNELFEPNLLQHYLCSPRIPNITRTLGFLSFLTIILLWSCHLAVISYFIHIIIRRNDGKVEISYHDNQILWFLSPHNLWWDILR